ncbi:hypothetical protein PFISCL1PPCAC_6736, partial [Pristionchus fissidentatus]
MNFEWHCTSIKSEEATRIINSDTLKNPYNNARSINTISRIDVGLMVDHSAHHLGRAMNDLFVNTLSFPPFVVSLFSLTTISHFSTAFFQNSKASAHTTPCIALMCFPLQTWSTRLLADAILSEQRRHEYESLLFSAMDAVRCPSTFLSHFDKSFRSWANSEARFPVLFRRAPVQSLSNASGSTPGLGTICDEILSSLIFSSTTVIGGVARWPLEKSGVVCVVRVTDEGSEFLRASRSISLCTAAHLSSTFLITPIKRFRRSLSKVNSSISPLTSSICLSLATPSSQFGRNGIARPLSEIKSANVLLFSVQFRSFSHNCEFHFGSEESLVQ